MKEEMDALSHLPGADAFHALLAREAMRRARTGETLSIAIVDLDGLREVNARHGAASGTELLRVCANALETTLRGIDQLARTGPDEFSALLHATDARSANLWATRFEDALDAATRDHPATPVTCSFGIADTEEGLTLLEVAAKARRRMEIVQSVRKLRRTSGS
jgi:diguanylate cyclase (GGDEF)-like protein